PAIAMSVTSPKPIASFFRTISPSQPAMAIAPAEAHAPINESYSDAKGEVSFTKTPTNAITSAHTNPNAVKPSGITYSMASVSTTPKRIVPNTATRSAVSPGPYAATAPSQPSATASSTSGYMTEIGCRQPRQRARRASQLTIGTFSNHAISCEQLGQR